MSLAEKVDRDIAEFRRKHNGPNSSPKVQGSQKLRTGGETRKVSRAGISSERENVTRGKKLSHAKRLSVIVVERNGDGNYLRQWSGHWFDVGSGTFEEKKRAALQSLSDALERQSPIRESAQTYPHRD